MTGVRPRGAQVRRVTGNSEAPDSSQNTIAARRRRALARILGPVLGHPAGDRLLVALDGAAGGALQGVAHAVAQQLPGVAGVIGDPGQPFDHRGDAGKGPVVGVEAVRAGTLAQRLVNDGKLGIRQARGVPGGAGAAQPLQAAGLPLGVPAADVFPAPPRLGAVPAGGGVGGVSHTLMLPGHPRSCPWKGRASLESLLLRSRGKISEGLPSPMAPNSKTLWLTRNR